METAINQQDKRLSPERKMSRSLAKKAEKEFLETGNVSTRCPKCDGHPIVERDSHRTFVKCPCGFIHKFEFLEI